MPLRGIRKALQGFLIASLVSPILLPSRGLSTGLLGGSFYNQPMAPRNYFAITKSAELDTAWKYLTSGQAQKESGGRLPKFTPEQAAGLIGSWIVETGRPNLKGLDVVEKGAGLGRGLSQYTGERRIAYDRARTQALASGQDPNSIQWQLKYFVQEYVGKHDLKPGASLSGWTRVFENSPAKGSPGYFAQYFTGSAATGTGYFRPSVPHLDKRQNAASQVYKLFQSPPTPPPPVPGAVPEKKNLFQIPFFKSEAIPGSPQGPYTPLPSPGWNPGMAPMTSPTFRPSPIWERILPTGAKVPFA